MGVSVGPVTTAPSAVGQPTLPRLAKLRQDLLEAPYSLCTQKAELLTEYFLRNTKTSTLARFISARHFSFVAEELQRNLGRGTPQSSWQTRLSNFLQRYYLRSQEASGTEPLIRTYAKALAYALQQQHLEIYPDELIVGNLTRHRIGATIHPDFGGLLMLPELDELPRRRVNPLQVSPEQVRRLKEKIFPFWFSRSLMARAPLLARDPELQNTLMRGRSFILTQFAGISHVTPDYPTVLSKGFAGILAEAELARANAGEANTFYEAAAIVARAVIDYGARWSAHCAAAARDADPVRARELRDLAEILARVPAKPARTFHEALQSVFLTHVIVHQESFQHGVSFGRVDQYLYPYYAREVAAGVLDRPRAIELIGCFLAKAAEQLPLFNSMATEFFSGLSSASGLTLGGTDAAGEDASNDLTTLFLEAYDQMRLRQPNVHLRVHPGLPIDVRLLACDVLKKGGGMPALFNDAGVIPALRELGVSEADARDYSIVGCVEWGVPYRSFPAAGAVFLSLPAVLDDALHRYANRVPRHEHSIDGLVRAFRGELERVVLAAVDGNNAIEKAHARFRPTPFLSILVRGCMESGRDVTAGGALYNSTGMQGVGVADVADSLAAIDRLVFTDGRLTLSDLVAALDSDFAENEALRHELLNKRPRYGADDGAPEAYARLVAEMYAKVVRRHRNPRGGPYAPGFWTMTTHVGFGSRLGSLPSGRRRGQALSDGLSPANGADGNGPTASLMSVARASGAWVGNGLALNEKLDPCFVVGSAGSRLLDALTRGYFDAGGLQVQYNIIDPGVLIDAKRHPERHRGLVVRISGYSAYFNDLTEAMKDDIIARTLHGRGEPACRDTAGGAP